MTRAVFPLDDRLDKGGFAMVSPRQNPNAHWDFKSGRHFLESGKRAVFQVDIRLCERVGPPPKKVLSTASGRGFLPPSRASNL